MSQTSLWDVLGYLTYANPLSQAVINTTVTVAKGTQNLITKSVPPPTPVILPLHQYVGANYTFVRLAGISGVAAILLSVYGKGHLTSIVDIKRNVEANAIFDRANRFHFVHTCALLAVPIVHHPVVTGSLLVVGTAMLSGAMYYRAFTGDTKLRQVATCGGFCIIAAWLSLLF